VSSKSVIADPLLGPKLKVERAKSHLADFKSGWEAFKNSAPFEDISYDDPATGERVFALRMIRDPPADLPLILGDAVHNLRSALDQMVCAFVRFNGKEVTRYHGFPIRRNKKKFREACIANLKDISPKANRFIRRLKPYKTGNYNLWFLAHLDNMDKHNQLVSVVISNVTVGVLHRNPTDIMGMMPGTMPLQRELPADGIVLSQGDQEIRRFPKYRLHPARKPRFAFSITLGERHGAQGQVIVETLDKLINLVEKIVFIADRNVI